MNRMHSKLQIAYHLYHKTWNENKKMCVCSFNSCYDCAHPISNQYNNHCVKTAIIHSSKYVWSINNLGVIEANTESNKRIDIGCLAGNWAIFETQYDKWHFDYHYFTICFFATKQFVGSEPVCFFVNFVLWNCFSFWKIHFCFTCLLAESSVWLYFS